MRRRGALAVEARGTAALTQKFAKVLAELTTGEAAKRLGVTPQTVRNWLASNKLGGQRRQSGRWEVDPQSVAEVRGALSQASAQGHELAAIESRLEELVTTVDAMRAQLQEDLEGAERERSQHRAEVIALRGAALEVNAAAQALHGGVDQMLEVLSHQSQALSHLLGPGTVSDFGEQRTEALEN